MRSTAQFLIALSLASQAIRAEKNFALFTRTKYFREMAQVQAQQFIDVVAQLLQIPFGSRNTADPNRTTTTTNASIAVEDREQIVSKTGTQRRIGFVAGFLQNSLCGTLFCLLMLVLEQRMSLIRGVGRIFINGD